MGEMGDARTLPLHMLSITQTDNAPASPDKIWHLLQGASKGSVSDVKQILDEGLPVDSADYDGRTALHLAASEGRYPVVELLLNRHALVNPVDRSGNTPLADANRFGLAIKGSTSEASRRKLEYAKVSELLHSRGGVLPPQESQMGEKDGSDYEIDRAELDFDQGQVIGQGCFGQVVLVTWRGTKVAAKMILDSLAQSEETQREFRLELSMLEKLRHPNIVQFLGAVSVSTPLIIVTEFLPNGDLHDIVEKKGRIPAKDAVKYALDIARGMNYLHQHRPPIVHRDLKPRNLIQDEAGHLKVADFGLSKLLAGRTGCTEYYQMTGETGTYRYMAPEVFLHKSYDKSVDVFSFAIIVHEMFEGGQGLKNTPPHDVAKLRAQRDIRPPFFVKYPTGMKELLRQCWDKEAAQRPNFAVIISRLEAILVELKGGWKPPNIAGKLSRFVHGGGANKGPKNGEIQPVHTVETNSTSVFSDAMRGGH